MESLSVNKSQLLSTEKKDYFTYEMFCVNLVVTAKQKSRGETWNEKTEQITTETHQLPKVDRNRRKKTIKIQSKEKAKSKWQ